MPPEPDRNAELLAAFLAANDAACPECKYVLRDLRIDACPECGCPLRLDIRRGPEPQHARQVLLVAFAWPTLLLLGHVANSIADIIISRRVGPSAFQGTAYMLVSFLQWGWLFLSGGVALVLFLVTARRLSRPWSERARRQWLVAAWVLLGGQAVLWIAMQTARFL